MRVFTGFTVLALLVSGVLAAPLNGNLQRRGLTVQEHHEMTTLKTWFDNYSSGSIMSTPEVAAENKAKLRRLLNKFNEYTEGENMATPELVQDHREQLQEGEPYDESPAEDVTSLKKWAKAYQSGTVKASHEAAAANYEKLSLKLYDWFQKYDGGEIITFPEMVQENRQALLTANVEKYRQLLEVYKTNPGRDAAPVRKRLVQALRAWFAVESQFTNAGNLAEEYRVMVSEDPDINQIFNS